MIKEEKFYTSGKFAKKAGITLKTIRHYEKIAILKPTKINESGYRLYSEADFEKLQRILTFKYLGYSLEEIKKLVTHEVSREEIMKSIKYQQKFIQEKITKIKEISIALEEVENMMKKQEEIQWEKFVRIIELINLDRYFEDNFRTSKKLNTRVSLHDKYSTNDYGWFKWVFDNLKIEENHNILELGCGTGLLWEKNRERIPERCSFTLFDKSQEMLQVVGRKFENDNRFKEFVQGDIPELPFEDESFDVVIANHVLYFIKDIKRAMKEMKRVLKKGGKIYTTTFSKDNFKELKEIVKQENEDIIYSRIDLINSYLLENAEDNMREFFEEINCFRYIDELEVTNSEELIDYIKSTSGNITEVVDENGIKRIRDNIQNEIDINGYFYIKKDVGIVCGQKKKI